MSKKHFIAIAADIRYRLERCETVAEDRTMESLACDLASTFAGFNPAFNRARFLAACGVENV